jgi:hypothetical protein
MKVSELTGVMLDLWVAKADGATIVPAAEFAKARENTAWLTDDKWIGDEPGSEPRKLIRWGPDLYGVFSPSTTWSDGGPIIERAAIGWRDRGRNAHVGVHKGLSSWEDQPWEAWYCDDGPEGGNPEMNHVQVGPTLLIAAMRAFVASKFGDTVPDA